jgi:hypothetical protein
MWCYEGGLFGRAAISKEGTMDKLSTRNVFALAMAVLILSACGGGLKGVPGGDSLKGKVPAKYEAYMDKCEAYQKDIDEAKKYLEDTPRVLAESLDLKEGATLEEVTEAIRSRIQDEVVKAGAHVEIEIEGGIEASAAGAVGTGGASAEAGVSAEVKVTITVVGEIEVSEGLQELIDAGKLALERLIGSAKKLKAIAEEAPDLIEEGVDLAASAKTDIQNPAVAAKVVAKITGYKDMFGEVAGLFDASFEMQIEVKASFTLEASAEAEAG